MVAGLPTVPDEGLKLKRPQLRRPGCFQMRPPHRTYQLPISPVTTTTLTWTTGAAMRKGTLTETRELA